MIKLPVHAIANPGHLSFVGTAEEDVTTSRRIEVYTGWIDFSFNRMGEYLANEEIQTFLPVSRNTLAEYQPDALIDQAVSASPSAWINDEDELNMVAVSNGRINLSPRKFKYIDKEKTFWVLVLTVTIAAAKLNLRGITYNITLHTNMFAQIQAGVLTRVKNPELPLDGAATP
jgi:hypothetical protein